MLPFIFHNDFKGLKCQLYSLYMCYNQTYILLSHWIVLMASKAWNFTFCEQKKSFIMTYKTLKSVFWYLFLFISCFLKRSSKLLKGSLNEEFYHYTFAAFQAKLRHLIWLNVLLLLPQKLDFLVKSIDEENVPVKSFKAINVNSNIKHSYFLFIFKQKSITKINTSRHFL